MSSPPGARLAAGLLFLLAGGAALAVTGTVKDTEGKPLAGVRVCEFQQESGIELHCVRTDAGGRFEVVSVDEMTIRIVADGYFAKILPAAGHYDVVLERSPTLIAHLVDATGEPVDEGKIWVIYPSAKKKGPFPVSRGGVRIERLLEPGEVRVIGESEGHEDGAPVRVTLVPGKESEVTVTLGARQDP